MVAKAALSLRRKSFLNITSTLGTAGNDKRESDKADWPCQMPIRYLFQKSCSYYGAAYYYYNRYGDAMTNQKWRVCWDRQQKENNLEFHCPTGTVRSISMIRKEPAVCRRDSIDHTPKTRKSGMKLGMPLMWLGKQKTDRLEKDRLWHLWGQLEISLRKPQERGCVVKVVEPDSGWLEKCSVRSHEYKKTEAFTAEFSNPGAKTRRQNYLSSEDEVFKPDFKNITFRSKHMLQTES